ncbi:unnamed protein product [Dibothriocephalus latus]|uniref:Uncharacterized protein n=1 Tax=Dibothriocephalus latus TaxID=60516 RepID=A0A3P7M5B3_DIBLA|nr:unnamed protein product [Dibothriocephalus latus]
MLEFLKNAGILLLGESHHSNLPMGVADNSEIVDCSIGVTSRLCKNCFLESIHTKHSYHTEKCCWGLCTCGHDDCWSSGACCRTHGDGELQEKENRPKSGGCGVDAQVLLTVEEEQRQEIELLQQRLKALPLDLVKRCNYLLRPLIDSATLTLFGLIQAGEIWSLLQCP